MNSIIRSILAASSFCCALLSNGQIEGLRAHGHVPASTTYPKKPVTVLLYGSARNDLLPFIDRNIKQLMQIGTNDNITFLIHLDIFGAGRRKLTQRYIIMKNQIIQVGGDMAMDSGDPATLLDACTWAFKNFPADMTILDLWNHGTGDLEPSNGRAINSIELFKYNPSTNMIELNRSITFFDYLNQEHMRTLHRGICFDEATGHFLSNHQVGATLRTICDTCLDGKPLDFVLCDACLMQGIGFSYSLKPLGKTPVAKYLLGSQEVVLATGYAYNHMFEKLAAQPMAHEDFARHVVQVFADTYSKITHDYAQSAIHLEAIDPLYENIDRIACLLIDGLSHQSNRSVHRFIQKSASYDACTHFEEPSYKDIHHLCSNMIANIDMIGLTDATYGQTLKDQLVQELRTACALVKQIIVANNAGKNGTLKDAAGISIYLPDPDRDRRIDTSFPKSDFGQNNHWLDMLSLYMRQ